MTGLLRQVLLTVIGATAGLMAVLLLGSGGPNLSAGARCSALCCLLVVVWAVLVLRVLVAGFRRD